MNMGKPKQTQAETGSMAATWQLTAAATPQPTRMTALSAFLASRTLAMVSVTI